MQIWPNSSSRATVNRRWSVSGQPAVALFMRHAGRGSATAAGTRLLRRLSPP
jgi:hypothetical protein